MKIKLGIFVLLNLSFTLVIAQSTLGSEVSKYENCIADFVIGLLNCKDSNELLNQIRIYPLNSTSNEISLRLNPTLPITYFDEFIYKIQNKCSCDLSVGRCGCAASLGRKIIVSISVIPPSSTTTTSTTKGPETSTSPSTPIDKYYECIAGFTNGFVYCVNAQGLINETHISPINSSRMGEILKLNPTLPESFINTYVLNNQNECSCDMTIGQLCTCAAPLGIKVIIPISVIDSNQGYTTEASTTTTQNPGPTDKLEICDVRRRVLNCSSPQGIQNIIDMIITPMNSSNSYYEQKFRHNSELDINEYYQFIREIEKKCASINSTKNYSCAAPLDGKIKFLISLQL